MKSREELRNDYEEALFAMIMDDIMELEGEALVAERERLAASDEYKVPDDVDKRCLELINHSFEEHKKKENKRRTRKVWRTVLIAALVSCLCFSTVYAAVPAVKQATDNLIIAVSNVSAKILYGDKDNIQPTPEYTFWYIPDGFMIVQEVSENNSNCYRYTNDDAYIKIRINYEIGTREINIDTENADEIMDVEIGDFKGLLVKKEDMVRIAVVDAAHTNLIQITSKNVETQQILQIIENIRHTK